MARAIWVLSLVACAAIVANTRVGGDIYAEWLMVRAVADGTEPYVQVRDLAAAYGIDFLDWFRAVIPRTPGALVLMLPLALIPLAVLPYVASVLVVVFLSGTAWAIARIGGFPSHYAAAAMPLFMVSEVGYEIVLHRHVTMMAVPLLIAFAWLDMERSQDRRSGVLLGMATLLRLFPWTIVGAFLHKRRKIAVAGGVVFVALNLVGLMLPSVSVAGALGATASGSQFIGEVRNGSLVSLLGLPVWVSIVAGVLFIALVWNREAWGLSVPVSLLLAPIAWTMYLPVLLVPLAARRRFILLVGLPLIWIAFGISALSFGRAVTVMTFGSIAVVAADEWWALVRREPSMPV